MHGVIFGDKHSYRNWGLLLKSRPVVSPPVPKTKLIQVPGSDIVIDLTESLTGKVHYEPRTITCEFTMICDRSMWTSRHSDILNYLHGKSIRIILDDDPNYYFTGRATVGEISAGKKTASFTVTATVEPYKRERYGDGRRL